MKDSSKMSDEDNLAKSLFGEIQSLIDFSRRQAAVSVNFEMSLLYWHIGIRINQEELKYKRAEYGRKIV